MGGLHGTRGTPVMDLNPAGKNAVKLIQEFISSVQSVYATGNATEHSYRSAFESLFSGFGVSALNEPKPEKYGAPDFLVFRDGIVIGHVEAKNLGIDIRGMKGDNKSQQDRYKAALPNLIYTNALDWDFYRDGTRKASVTIADFREDIIPKPNNYDELKSLLDDFVLHKPQKITCPIDLAARMAGKAKLVKNVLYKALADEEAAENELAAQYRAFQENLIHDITCEDFADVYAETIAYGMFAARLHDPTLDSFSRQEALDLLPKSNPFLRSLFRYLAGHELDDRIRWIIDDLACIFQACDVAKLIDKFRNLTGRSDPFLHFYETFLAAYNPDKRQRCGVWYTPAPVVNFIVRAVDDVLKDEFGLPDGLADTSRVKVDWDTGKTKGGKRVIIKKDVHRVQILDPAVGTGTFLAEAVKQIAPRICDAASSMWSSYIEQDLIPRLHGLELLMASYAMCHMKLDMILSELNYKPTTDPPRLRVYLSNSLEKGEDVHSALPFAKWISREAEGAYEIKHKMPIMCVIGNPPYSGEGGVSEGWIGDLMDDYKKEPGGKVKLEEKNPKWLNDLYVKFIRMSSYMIEENRKGVLGFITNHSYLDNLTFRGMRWHLLDTFDRILILNLHGNAHKKEVAPDGTADQNVFDIKQGVAIIIAVKTGNKDAGLAEVCYDDLWGTRKAKYESLYTRPIGNLLTKKISCSAPQYAFVKRDHNLAEVYEKGFQLNKFMPLNSVGIITSRDALTIDNDKEELWKRVQEFSRLNPEEARNKFALKKDVRDWKVALAQQDLQSSGLSEKKIAPILYRLFDTRYTYYTGKSRGFLCMPRNEVMQHMLEKNNIALITCRQQARGHDGWAQVFITSQIIEGCAISNVTKEINSLSPLYLYPTDALGIDQAREVNFDPKLYKRLQDLATQPGSEPPDEWAAFDYIYGVLHCPAYRETYAEFLKTDFPHIPWPSSPEEFQDVSSKGTELRKLHLMEPQAIGPTPFPFRGDGDNVVDKQAFKDGKVWINKLQYFDNAPEVSWNLHIGGYQPAQKWLKDRKGRKLDYDDVKHYQRILKILAETDRIMGTIDMEIQ